MKPRASLSLVTGSALLAVLALFSPAQAQDIRQQVEGDWGVPGIADLTCTENPVRIHYDPTRRVLIFRWRHDIRDADGTARDRIDYRVTGTGEGWLALRRMDTRERHLMILARDAQSFGLGPDADPVQSFPVHLRCPAEGADRPFALAYPPRIA